jgi:hypothetical protein
VPDLVVCELILPSDRFWQDKLLGTCRCQCPEGDLGHKWDWSVTICEAENARTLELAGRHHGGVHGKIFLFLVALQLGYYNVFQIFQQFTIQEGCIKYSRTMEGIEACASASFSKVSSSQTKKSLELEDLSAWMGHGILSQLSLDGTVGVMSYPEVSDEFRLLTKPYSIFRI